jgi:hypothetical protein
MAEEFDQNLAAHLDMLNAALRQCQERCEQLEKRNDMLIKIANKLAERPR